MSHQDATRLARYFDFVWPYPYLQFEAYPEPMHGAALRPVLLDYLADPSVFDEAKMQRIFALAVGAARKP
ncbi:MAG: hypothetical protein V1796_06735 [Pseudomonadota bacterium]